MAVKKKSGGDAGYDKFRADLDAGTLGTVYIFHGEESYLREYYLTQMRKQLVPDGFEEFNYHRLEGKGVTAQLLQELCEAMPMMAQRTMVQIVDLDLFKMNEEQRNGLIALLDDFPDYCCLVLVYDRVEYKPNKTYKKLCAALDKNAQVVKFEEQSQSEILKWVSRRFKATGHVIDAPTAEHLQSTHERMFRRIREAKPDLPIILLSRPKFSLTEEEEVRLEIIRVTYRNALGNADNNVYLIDGRTLMALAGDEGTVDNCHPTDFGFMSMAKAVGDLLEKLQG